MQHKVKYLVFLIVLFFLFGCFGEAEKKAEQNEDANSKLNVNGMNFKFYQSGCKCGIDTELIVKTKYFNVPDSVNFWGVVVLKQELIFRLSKGRSRTLSPPFKSTKHLFVSKDSLQALETMVVDVKCLQKGGNSIYQLHGIYSFDPPHEFFALCSLEGEWLWYYYGSMHETYKKYGNEQPYESEYGKEIHNLKNMVKVFPPVSSKKH